MASPTEITADQLTRLIGLPDAPALIDVRIDEDYSADPRMLPAATIRDHRRIADCAREYKDRKTVVVCQSGHKLSQGTAAWLRHIGIAAETLEGGFERWRDGGHLLWRTENLPPLHANGATVWVTRSRPKIDRIACPWLIRRFIDPTAVFLFVSASEVLAVAKRFDATPFDIDDVFWSHRGELCTFDVMLDEFGLASDALKQLALIVRAADTARLDLVPQAAGLLAASLGFSRMFRDDLAQLAAAMHLYDAFYRWCRDATGESHNWPSAKQGV